MIILLKSYTNLFPQSCPIGVIVENCQVPCPRPWDTHSSKHLFINKLHSIQFVHALRSLRIVLDHWKHWMAVPLLLFGSGVWMDSARKTRVSKETRTLIRNDRSLTHTQSAVGQWEVGQRLYCLSFWPTFGLVWFTHNFTRKPVHHYTVFRWI